MKIKDLKSKLEVNISKFSLGINFLEENLPISNKKNKTIFVSKYNGLKKVTVFYKKIVQF